MQRSERAGPLLAGVAGRGFMGNLPLLVLSVQLEGEGGNEKEWSGGQARLERGLPASEECRRPAPLGSLQSSWGSLPSESARTRMIRATGAPGRI